MKEIQVAIVGSGIVGTTLAYLLTRQGHQVVIFEKGPEYPYPHSAQFTERIRYLHENPAYRLPSDVKHLTLSGEYSHDLNDERAMVVGGSATKWQAVTLRMTAEDFATRSRYGYGTDWPLTYADLEPYYCRAEALLGVSGTDTDNPFSPWRSQPYPLPPFELSADDRILAGRLREHGIHLHTTPQARTRAKYEDRVGCLNFGTCQVCPIGARYSPNHHLLKAVKTGRCTVHTNTSVRRILFDGTGRARALVYQQNESGPAREHPASVIIVAAGAIESARLLLLSANNQAPPGLAGGQVGQHLVFHHLWTGRLRYAAALFPGRTGMYTGQSHQFLDPPDRGKYGGVKVELSSHSAFRRPPAHPATAAEAVRSLAEMRHWRVVVLHAESSASPMKYVTLSKAVDRFGDPFGHVHYESADFDHETRRYAEKIFDRFVQATTAEAAELNEEDEYSSGAHHMGTCRMGNSARDSVVDDFGKVHGSPNLFVIGGSNFVSTSALNPTLTMVALAIRTADYIDSQVL